MSDCAFPALKRFVDAQAENYDTALKEIKNGNKRSHWMWYIFPQLRGLGRSDMAYYYGVVGLEEAKAYLAHSLLGARLEECCEALLAHKTHLPENILGDIDAMKLRSSMTLFALVSDEGSLFHKVLDTFYQGKLDERTVALLEN